MMMNLIMHFISIVMMKKKSSSDYSPHKQADFNNEKYA
jgi:hypothetical protein